MSSNTILPYKMALLSAELRGVIRIIFSALRGLYNYHSHACKVNIQFYMDTHRSTTQIVHVNHCLNCIFQSLEAAHSRHGRTRMSMMKTFIIYA